MAAGGVGVQQPKKEMPSFWPTYHRDSTTLLTIVRNNHTAASNMIPTRPVFAAAEGSASAPFTCVV